jgi:hypothetical protein
LDLIKKSIGPKKGNCSLESSTIHSPILIFRITIFVLLASYCLTAFGQSGQSRKQSQGVSSCDDSSAYLAWPIRAVCKGYSLHFYALPASIPFSRNLNTKGVPKRKPLISVHGNIYYDMFYRSQVDTPFSENNVHQHTVQTTLDILYKDQYPFRVFLTNRFGNSNLSRKLFDVNLQFNASEFQQGVKRKIEAQLKKSFFSDSILQYQNKLKEFKQQIFSIDQWLNSPSKIQALLDARERDLRSKRLQQPDTFDDNFWQKLDLRAHKNVRSSGRGMQASKPSTEKVLGEVNSNNYELGVQNNIDQKQHELDSLKLLLASLEPFVERLLVIQQQQSVETKNQLLNVQNGKVLKTRLADLGIEESTLPKGYSTLLSVKSFGVGRTLVDYSELSAKNLSITGIQIEYNPSFYAAVAAGSVDYRFRDYSNRQSRTGQYVGVVRYGRGTRNGNSLIFTYYNGRRSFYNSVVTVNNIPESKFNLMGITLESSFSIGKVGIFKGEVAKSSAPYFNQDSTKRNGDVASLVTLSNRANMAAAVTFTSFVAPTKTNIELKYRHIGADFQSFSIYSIGSLQRGWSAKLYQTLLRNKISILGSVRFNDFSNPYLVSTYRSNSVYKSIQATFRFKKVPTLTVSYSPSLQAIKLGEDKITENMFYTLNATASHSYRLNTLSIVSIVGYNRFYNHSSDSNFVYYNSRNLFFTQSIFWNKVQLQAQVSMASNTTYTLYVIDNRIQYEINKYLSVECGAKYNRQSLFQLQQFGYSGKALIRMKHIGHLQILADQGFLPGPNKRLVKNETGRFTFYKNF